MHSGRIVKLLPDKIKDVKLENHLRIIGRDTSVRLHFVRTRDFTLEGIVEVDLSLWFDNR
jgi:hypothetical protein